MRYALNRELGEALHNSDPDAFRKTFVAAYVVCAALTGLAALTFLVLIAIVPVFEVPDHLVTPARWALAARGSYTCVMLALTPSINMLVISERMTLFNLWMVIERAAPLTTAIVLFPVMGISDPAQGLVLFAAWSALGMVAAAVGATVVAAAQTQSEVLLHAMGDAFADPKRIELMEKLAEISGLDRAILGCSGSDSVEAAIKTARMALPTYCHPRL